VSRYAAGGLTSAGSTTLPLASIYATTGGRIWINEIGVYNTTATAVALKLVRLTTAGTSPAALTSAPVSLEDPAVAIGNVHLTHTVAPTLGADLGYRCVLGAAVGSGNIWTWPDRVLTITATANAGIGLIVENGTGQPVQFYVAWGE
jgi:hypothetical protein